MESELKQAVIVCDSNGTVKVTLWEENIDILEQQTSYCLLLSAPASTWGWRCKDHE